MTVPAAQRAEVEQAKVERELERQIAEARDALVTEEQGEPVRGMRVGGGDA